ncbi:MAG: hypothetical protein D6675_10130 [Gemmatimonadetes bacterium]|nr:MAG: hypothetical protein D6675_10130 [Gemmatimonadota bacterium]
MKKINVLLIGWVLSAISCQPSALPTTTSPLGEQFVLGWHQTVHLKDTGLSLTFAEVVEDSRCPQQVECVWEGQVVIKLKLQASNNPPQEIELTLRAGHPESAVQTVGEYTIELLNVHPYPQKFETTIKPSRYRAVLVVSELSSY